jgi:hypothetical protein
MVHAFLERAEGAMRFEEVTFCRLRRWVYMSHRLHAEQPGIEAGRLPILNGLRRFVMFVRWQGGSRLARGFDFPIPMDGRMEWSGQVGRTFREAIHMGREGIMSVDARAPAWHSRSSRGD